MLPDHIRTDRPSQNQRAVDRIAQLFEQRRRIRCQGLPRCERRGDLASPVRRTNIVRSCGSHHERQGNQPAPVNTLRACIRASSWSQSTDGVRAAHLELRTRTGNRPPHSLLGPDNPRISTLKRQEPANSQRISGPQKYIAIPRVRKLYIIGPCENISRLSVRRFAPPPTPECPQKSTPPELPLPAGSVVREEDRLARQAPSSRCTSASKPPRNFVMARASSWRIRSFETPNRRPICSSVCGSPASSRP